MSPKLSFTPCRCNDLVPVSGGKPICNNLNCEGTMFRKPTTHPDGIPYCSHMVCPKFGMNGRCSELDAEPTDVCLPAVREAYGALAASRAIVTMSAERIRVAEDVRDDARRASQRDLELRREHFDVAAIQKEINDGEVLRLRAHVQELLREKPWITEDLRRIGDALNAGAPGPRSAPIDEAVKMIEYRMGVIRTLQDEVGALRAKIAELSTPGVNVCTSGYCAGKCGRPYAPVEAVVPLTWTCAACGDIHPIDHEGLFCSGCQAMICCSCETKYEPKHNCAYTFRKKVGK